LHGRRCGDEANRKVQDDHVKGAEECTPAEARLGGGLRRDLRRPSGKPDCHASDRLNHEEAAHHPETGAEIGCL